jgi:general secretion pathway protein E
MALTETRDELLSLGEATALLGISKPTMYRLLAQGKVKGVKVGNQWRFRRADLQAYLERGPVAMALSGVPLDVLDAELAHFTAELQRHDGPAPVEAGDDPAERKTAALAAAVINLAYALRASDIHFDPLKDGASVIYLLRYRIDGVLVEARRFTPRVYDALLLRMKVLAGIDGQDAGGPLAGHITVELPGGPLELRVAVTPTLHGDMLSARLLASAAEFHLGLERRGFSPDSLERLQRWLRQGSGFILFTGPTGSGKTSTMYEAVMTLATGERAVYSLEDPVEVQLPWVTQIAVSGKGGMTFPQVFRNLVWSDPDVIMLGLMRDLGTIEIGLHAARTGHLVISQAFSETASWIPGFLVDVFPEVQRSEITQMVANTAIGVVCQRLVRRLCPACRQAATFPAAEAAELIARARDGGYLLPADAVFYRPAGCPACNGQGYSRRIALYELLEFTPAVKRAYLAGATPDALQALAVKDGMRTLAAEGLRLAAEGVTSVEEVLRVI